VVLPEWLNSPHKEKLALKSLRLGQQGLVKSVNVGRDEDLELDYVNAFIHSINDEG